ncbi:MAG: hypothetical protein IJZ46_02435 [Bacilli bacterium]|nr:hypothetical protein [Bacilli bacterium]
MKNNKAKVVGVVLGIILFLTLISGITYAWYVWSTDEADETQIATNVGAITVKYDAGSSIIGRRIKPVSDKTQGIRKGISVSIDQEAVNEVIFNLYLDINELDEGLKHSSFKYEFYKSDTLITNGNFANLTTTECNEDSSINHIQLLTEEKITTAVSTYELYIWIDGNEDNPTSMQEQDFSFTLHADGKNAIGEIATYPDITNIQEGTFAYNIVNKYLSSNSYKEETVGTVKYRLDTTNNLISDVDGNVRYYGADAKNYVNFNCDTYPETGCETWRIIGVFDDKVKLMNSETIGNLSWDYDYNDDSTNITGHSNDWQYSSLKDLLNNEYLNNEDTTYYNYSSGSAVEKTMDFNKDGFGIKNKTKDLIADVMYNLGGYSDPQPMIYADEMYKYERSTSVFSGNSTIWYGKIAVPYLSDFLYATDFRECNVAIMGYNNVEACKDTSWMATIISSSGASYSSLLTPITSASTHIFLFDAIQGGHGYNRARGASPYIFPVLFLNADTVVSNVGDGSQGNPYRIIVNQ